MSVDMAWQASLLDHLDHVIGGYAPVCKICGAQTQPFDVVDLEKSCSGLAARLSGVSIYYFHCENCGLVFTDFFDSFTPTDWRTVIYNDDYYDVHDPEYEETRPAWNTLQVAAVTGGPAGIIGLDYGGGNGRTAELLRRRGFVYESYDPYGLSDLTAERRKSYNFCSAFEVAEHTGDPVGMMADIVERCTDGPLIVLIGTLALDGHIADPIRLNWWYAAPRNGHITLFSRRALATLGERFGLSLVSLNESQHVFFRGHTPAAIRRKAMIGKAKHRLVSAMAARARGLKRLVAGKAGGPADDLPVMR